MNHSLEKHDSHVDRWLERSHDKWWRESLQGDVQELEEELSTIKAMVPRSVPELDQNKIRCKDLEGQIADLASEITRLAEPGDDDESGPLDAPTEPKAASAPASESAAVNPTGRRWTLEALDELREYRKGNGTKEAALHFRISEALVRRLLPSDNPPPKGFSAFNQRK